jgi:hypothetical protein
MVTRFHKTLPSCICVLLVIDISMLIVSLAERKMKSIADNNRANDLIWWHETVLYGKITSCSFLLGYVIYRLRTAALGDGEMRPNSGV